MHLTPSPQAATADAGIVYPTGDGRPMAETPVHGRNLRTLIDVLERWFAADPQVYVCGNMLMYYEKGNRHKHVSPDVFVARGVPKDKPRKAYFVWEEGRGPNLVIELTSASTRDEDVEEKKSLYEGVLAVDEYILFDPFGEYLEPALQGFRLQKGKYAEIGAVDGRLPSDVLGLQFEACGEDLRLYNPADGRWLPTAQELLAESAEKLNETAAERDRLIEENKRLLRELAKLRRRPGRK